MRTVKKANLLPLTLGALLLLGQSAHADVPVTPASYAVSTKVLKDGVYKVRIAAYSFRSDATVRSDYWEWTSADTSYDYDPVTRVGVGGESTPPYPMDDDDKYVQTEGSFLGGESSMTTELGTYVTWNGNTQIKITWNDGTLEYWKRTWHDARLNKIELYYTNRATIVRDTYLSYKRQCRLGRQLVWCFRRNEQAQNAGFGFGAPYGFDNTGLPIEDFDQNYKGLVSRWNAYYEPPDDNEGIIVDSINHTTYYTLTSNNVWRYVYLDYSCKKCVDENRPYWDFYYTARPAWNPGMTSRRVLIQKSHDWNDNYHVADNYGHMYFGLEVIDHAGFPRGFVFADATWDIEGYMAIMSAMFYIDDHSTAAQTGIE